MLLHACPVQKSESQRFVNPMSGLLFCTTCCLAQPCLERRGGWERQKGKRWSVTHGLSPCFIRLPFLCLFSFLPSLWFQVSAEHLKRTSNRTGWELILTQRKVWTANKYSVEFASTRLCCYGNHLYFFAVFVHLGYPALGLKGHVNTLHMTFLSFSVDMVVK